MIHSIIHWKKKFGVKAKYFFCFYFLIFTQNPKYFFIIIIFLKPKFFPLQIIGKITNPPHRCILKICPKNWRQYVLSPINWSCVHPPLLQMMESHSLLGFSCGDDDDERMLNCQTMISILYWQAIPEMSWWKYLSKKKKKKGKTLC